MTTAGLQVFNDNGSILIDQNYVNLALRGKGTVAIGTNAANGGYLGTELFGITLGQPPLIAIRSSGFVSIADVGLDRFSYHLAKGVETFDYWFFGPPPVSTARYGLQVFDDSGKLVFDSNLGYVRMMQFINTQNTGMIYPDSGGVSSLFQYPITNAANAAFVFADPGYCMQLLTGTPVVKGLDYRSIAMPHGRIVGNNMEIALCQTVDNLSLPSGVNISSRLAWAPSSILMVNTIAL